MKIARASDHAGFAAKERIKEYLLDRDHEVVDCGTFDESSCDYPDFAYKAATEVASGECEKGVLICGTGIGVSICANKVKGIRCALCNDELCVEMCRKHNDANMIAMGARVIPEEKMEKLVDIFLSTEFEGGRHQRRVDKMMEIENK